MPSKQINVDELFFDDKHVNIDKNHNVTELEAKSYIRNSVLTLERYNGDCWIFVSKSGTSYVRLSKKSIDTAFSKDQYDDTMDAIIKELEEHGIL